MPPKRIRPRASKSEKKLDNSPKRRKPSPVPDAVQLDPDGDAVLVFSNEKKFLVSSKVMSLTSSMFRAMFGNPHFKEGSQLRNGEIPVVDLDEDDPAAMEMILRILHHKSPNTSRVCKDQKFRFQLAVCCDKYDFTEALRYWIATWLGQYRYISSRKALDAMRIRAQTAEDCGLILASVYLFRDPILPKLAIKVAATMKQEWMDVWEKQGILRILPDKFIDELANTVNTVLDQMDNILKATDERLVAQKCKAVGAEDAQVVDYDCRALFHTTLGASECFEMPAVVPLSFATGSLAEIECRLKKADIEVHDKHSCQGGYGCPLKGAMRGMMAEANNILSGIQEIKAGIVWAD